MFNSKPVNTVELSETVLKLDALYASYDSIFSEVKQQLETLDVTDAQITRITDNLMSNRHLIERVATKSIYDLTLALKDATEEDLEGKVYFRGMLDAIANRVLDKIMAAMDDYVECKMKERLAEVYTDEKLTEMMATFLSDSAMIKTAFRSQDCLEAMLEVLGYQKVNAETNN